MLRINLKVKNVIGLLLINVLEEPGVFGGDNNNITLITKDNIESWDKCSKTKVAKKLASKVIKEILDY